MSEERFYVIYIKKCDIKWWILPLDSLNSIDLFPWVHLKEEVDTDKDGEGELHKGMKCDRNNIHKLKMIEIELSRDTLTCTIVSLVNWQLPVTAATGPYTDRWHWNVKRRKNGWVKNGQRRKNNTKQIQRENENATTTAVGDWRSWPLRRPSAHQLQWDHQAHRHK